MTQNSKLLHLTLAVLLTVSASCSTIVTKFTGPNWKPPDEPLPQIYSGTLFDFRCMFQSEKYDTEGLGPFCFIDIPFSLIADTVVLPFSIYGQIKYGSYGTFAPVEEKKEEKKSDAKKSEVIKPDEKKISEKQIPDQKAADNQKSGTADRGELNPAPAK